MKFNADQTIRLYQLLVVFFVALIAVFAWWDIEARRTSTYELDACVAACSRQGGILWPFVHGDCQCK